MSIRLLPALLLGWWLGPALAAGEIAPGVTLVEGRFVPGQQPDGNSVIFSARHGLIVFDTGRHREHAQQVIDVVKASGQPLRGIVNSHWHLDHTGGNVLVRQAFPGARVFASDAIEAALLPGGFLANYRRDLEGAIAGSQDPAQQQAWRDEIALIDAGRQLAPDSLIRTAANMNFAGLRFDVGLELHAVTAGDVWLYDPSTRILAAGDLVTLPVPFLDTACPNRWREALWRIDQVGFERLVPGHGPVMDRAAFRTYRQAFGSLLACGASSAPRNECSDGWLRDAAPLLAGADAQNVRAMIDYYVDNSLRAPASHTDPLCGLPPASP